jgi:hypothetical protein
VQRWDQALGLGAADERVEFGAEAELVGVFDEAWVEVVGWFGAVEGLLYVGTRSDSIS